MIWNVPLVPFVAGLSLVAVGVIGAIAVDPSGVVVALLGLAGLGYQRDVSKHGVRRDDDTEWAHCYNCGESVPVEKIHDHADDCWQVSDSGGESAE